MGDGRETFGLGVYRDSEGIRYLIDLINGAKKDDYTGFSIHCASVTFESASELSPEDKALIKRSGHTYKGTNAFPQFTTMKPGKIQRPANEEEAVFLCCAIEQATAVADMLKTDSDLLLNARPRMLVRKQMVTNGILEWKNTWSDLLPLILDKIPIDPRIAEFARSVKRIPVDSAAVWICDMRFLPIPIMDDKEGGPYFGLVIMVFDTKTGFVLGMATAKYETFHAELMELVHNTIMKVGFQPKRIDTVRPEVFLTFDRYEYPVEVNLDRAHDISVIDDLWKNLLASQSVSRRRRS
jgi:hypothetical protein